MNLQMLNKATKRYKMEVSLSEWAGADPGFFLGAVCTRLLLYFNTNKPHSFSFCRRPVVLENGRSSQEGGVGGGGAHPFLPHSRSAPDGALLQES